MKIRLQIRTVAASAALFAEVASPPMIDMLEFGGYACLIRRKEDEHAYWADTSAATKRDGMVDRPARPAGVAAE